jgi:hypothetical protein
VGVSHFTVVHNPGDTHTLFLGIIFSPFFVCLGCSMSSTRKTTLHINLDFFFFWWWYWGFNSGPCTCWQVLYCLSHSTNPFVLGSFFFLRGSAGTLVWQLRASHLPMQASYHLSLSTTICIGYFQNRVSQTICRGLALNHDPPDLCLLSS